MPKARISSGLHQPPSDLYTHLEDQVDEDGTTIPSSTSDVSLPHSNGTVRHRHPLKPERSTERARRVIRQGLKHAAEDDPDRDYFQRGLGELVDAGEGSDEEGGDSMAAFGRGHLRGVDGISVQRRLIGSAASFGREDALPQDTRASTPVVPPDDLEGRERLEWQTMLASVLQGEVLKSEKTRMIGALKENEIEGRSALQYEIWLGLRARLRGRTVEDERHRLEERRLRVDAILEEARDFRADGDARSEAQTPSPPDALHQVEKLLRKIEYAESLYPHYAALDDAKPLYRSPEFKTKLDALNSWATVTRSLRSAVEALKAWTGSDDLDVTKKTQVDAAIIARPSEGGSLPVEEQQRKGQPAVEPTSFVERILKEDTMQRMFERRTLGTLDRILEGAKKLHIHSGHLFAEYNLPLYEAELLTLVQFPTRLMEEALKVRLDYAQKVNEPSVLVIDQMLDDFRAALAQACAIKKRYSAFMAPREPEPGQSAWDLPPCIDEDYDGVLLQALWFFFKLLHWKLKSGSKAIYFKETEILEEQWDFLLGVVEEIEGGDLLVAEHFSSLTNKLMVRVINYFEIQLKVPETKEMPPEEMTLWYNTILENVRLRYRKLHRFSKRLALRFDNSAEYDLSAADLGSFISALIQSSHFLVYADFLTSEGIYLVAEPSLADKPDKIRAMLSKAITVRSARARGEAVSGAEDGPLDAADQPGLASRRGTMATDGADLPPTAAVRPERRDSAEYDAWGSDGCYLLALSPRDPFWWTGRVLELQDMAPVELDLRERRVRLIADGPAKQLVDAKNRFLSIWDDPSDADVVFPLETLVAEQAHLPKINRELRKIARAAYRLSIAIVRSPEQVRATMRTIPGRQELLANWYSFAADHGQHAIRYMEPAAYDKFNRHMMHLAIQWVSFICDDCIPTDRKTFRWAVNALEFAMSMTRGENILNLEEDEFGMLRAKVASCMTLLISHFDILGARSSYEAKKEQEAKEEARRLRMMMSSAGAAGDEDEWGADEWPVEGGWIDLGGPDRSVRLTREEWVREIDALDAARKELEADQRMVGRVLDDEKPEDRSLVFLASSNSNISIRWQQGRFIGAGTFGSVYLGVNLDTGGIMAVKEIRFQDVNNTSTLYKQIHDEMRVMEMLSHPNIVEYYGIEVHRDKVYIFEEYCQGGSLSDLLEHGRIEDESVVRVYAFQMLEGLVYLHSQNVVHRDIKPDNILLDHQGVLKFVDFGAAKVLAKNKTMAARTRAGNRGDLGGGAVNNSLTGTPMYMSPEVIKGGMTGRHGAMDIWSLGCVVLELATGRKPWSQNLDNEWAIMFHIGIATKHPPLPERGELSDLGIDFIRQCLTIDANLRPNAEELMDHPWIRELVEGEFEEELAQNGSEFKSGAVIASQAEAHERAEIDAIKAESPPAVLTPEDERQQLGHPEHAPVDQ